MKNVKISDDANQKLLEYIQKNRGSKRQFLDLLLMNITPDEIQDILSRVWGRSESSYYTEDFTLKEPEDEEDEEVQFEPDDEEDAEDGEEEDEYFKQ